MYSGSLSGIHQHPVVHRRFVRIAPLADWDRGGLIGGLMKQYDLIKKTFNVPENADAVCKEKELLCAAAAAAQARAASESYPPVG